MNTRSALGGELFSLLDRSALLLNMNNHMVEHENLNHI
jgi:hypothetical protein